MSTYFIDVGLFKEIPCAIIHSSKINDVSEHQFWREKNENSIKTEPAR
jgi:hypothetical protein